MNDQSEVSREPIGLNNCKRTIVLGDLGHTTKVISSNFVPLGIGYIAAYLKKFYEKDINIVLFKDPEKLMHYVTHNKVDLVGLTNYAWNYRLSLYILKRCKLVCPEVATVLGGPNFSLEKPHIQLLLEEDRYIDFVVEGEGEGAFLNIVQRLQLNNFNLRMSKVEAIGGVYFIDINNKMLNSLQPKINDLDSIPSPYLTGLMDEFLLNDTSGFELSPLIENVRGCPFSCTFCQSGTAYYSKIRAFSVDRTVKELHYIAFLLKQHDRKIGSMMITDQNFGSMRHHVQIGEKMKECYDKTGFPIQAIAMTGKYNADTILETVSKFPGIYMTMAIQSSDETVLQNVKRKNFPLEKFVEYQKILRKQKRLSRSDVILGLPGDTVKTHLETLRSLLNVGIDFIDTFSYILLLGTPEPSLERRNTFGYETKWRLLHGGFSEINGEKIFESEEIVIATNTLSFEDYLYLRRIHLLLTTVCNGTIFKEMRKIMVERNLDIVTFLQKLDLFIRGLNEDNPLVAILNEFSFKTKGELFDSREELERYYSKKENYQDLIDDKAGENLLQKYKLRMMINFQELFKIVRKVYSNWLEENNCLIGKQDMDVLRVVEIKTEYIEKLLKGIPILKENGKTIELDYDVIEWVNNDTEEKLSSHHQIPSKVYSVHYTEKQLRELNILFQNREHKDYQRAKIIYRLGVESMIPSFSSQAQNEALQDVSPISSQVEQEFFGTY